MQRGTTLPLQTARDGVAMQAESERGPRALRWTDRGGAPVMLLGSSAIDTSIRRATTPTMRPHSGGLRIGL